MVGAQPPHIGTHCRIGKRPGASVVGLNRPGHPDVLGSDGAVRDPGIVMVKRIDPVTEEGSDELRTHASMYRLRGQGVAKLDGADPRPRAVDSKWRRTVRRSKGWPSLRTTRRPERSGLSRPIAGVAEPSSAVWASIGLVGTWRWPAAHLATQTLVPSAVRRRNHPAAPVPHTSTMIP